MIFCEAPRRDVYIGRDTWQEPEIPEADPEDDRQDEIFIVVEGADDVEKLLDLLDGSGIKWREV